MPRRPSPPDPSPAEIEDAFAANVAWLDRFGPTIPRHLIFTSIDMHGHGYREIAAELQRWLADGRLVETRTGDFMSRRMSHGVAGSVAESPEIRGIVSQSAAT